MRLLLGTVLVLGFGSASAEAPGLDSIAVALHTRGDYRRYRHRLELWKVRPSTWNSTLLQLQLPPLLRHGHFLLGRFAVFFFATNSESSPPWKKIMPWSSSPFI